jgi:hypothetical protein
MPSKPAVSVYFFCDEFVCKIPLADLREGKNLPIQPHQGLMSEIRESPSVSRMATYFVFIFLLAAIIETALATFGQ